MILLNSVAKLGGMLFLESQIGKAYLGERLNWVRICRYKEPFKSFTEKLQFGRLLLQNQLDYGFNIVWF